jgi:hypothetical protein
MRPWRLRSEKPRSFWCPQGFGLAGTMRLTAILGKWLRANKTARVSRVKARIPRSPLGQIPIARVKRTTKCPTRACWSVAAELSEVVALTFARNAGPRLLAGTHDRRDIRYLTGANRRSKIFGVEIHGRFGTEPIEIGL